MYLHKFNTIKKLDVSKLNEKNLHEKRYSEYKD